jgi:hypothetical protein
VNRFWLAALVGIALLAGCKRGVENEQAVRQAVIDYLAGRSFNVSSMQIDVTSVTFRQNEADAAVSFRPKGSKGAPGMTMNYKLEMKGNRWVVKGKAETGGMPHGSAPGAMPHGAMPGDAGAAMGQMPAGHPAIGEQKTPGTAK